MFAAYFPQSQIVLFEEVPQRQYYVDLQGECDVSSDRLVRHEIGPENISVRQFKGLKVTLIDKPTLSHPNDAEHSSEICNFLSRLRKPLAAERCRLPLTIR